MGPERPSGVHLFPLRSHCGLNGNDLLEGMHAAQRQHPIRELWAPGLRQGLCPRIARWVGGLYITF